MLMKQVSSIFWGTIALILFMYPYFVYAREFFGENSVLQKGDYLTVVGKAFAYQFFFMMFLFFITGFLEIMFRFHPAFSPSSALSLFYHTNSNWQDLIHLLVTNKAIVADVYKGGAEAGEASLAHQLIYNVMGVIIAFFFFFIPILSLFITFALVFKRDDSGRGASLATKTYIGSLSFSLLALVVYLHSMIASIYVSAFTGTRFSFYTIMTHLWHILLLEGKG